MKYRVIVSVGKPTVQEIQARCDVFVKSLK
jgi:hypothetical protein